MPSNPFQTMIDQDKQAMQPASNIADLATQNATEPSPGSPDHADQPPVPAAPAIQSMVQDQKAQTANNLQGSLYVTKDVNPDRHAKVMALAKELSLPVGVVDRRFDELYKDQGVDKTDFQKLLESNPKLADWMKDPDNAGIAKNTMPALQGVEDAVNTHTFTSQLLNALGQGFASLGSKVANLPAVAFDTLTQSYNQSAKRNADMAKKFGINPQDLADLDNQQAVSSGDPEAAQNMGQTEQIQTPDALVHNVITDAARYAKQSYDVKLPTMHYSVIAEAKDGNYLKAAQALTLQAASGAPDLVAAIGAGMIHPALGAAVFGAGSTASTSDEYRDMKDENGQPLLDPASRTAAAYTHGIIAAGAGEIKILDALKPYESAIANAAGKPVAREVMKHVFQTIGATVGVQGTTGAGMSLADDMADYVSGVNPKALEGTFERAGNAFAVGSATGLALGAVHNAGPLVDRIRQVNDTTNLKNFYQNITDQAKQIKFRDKLPEVQRDYIQAQTQDTPVENLYVNPERIETYFQSKGKNPVEEMQKLGILPEYGAAKESGGDMKIKTSDWVSKLGDTEHLTGLQNEVRFSPEGMSVNEIDEQHRQLQAEADAAVEAAKPKQPTLEEQANAFQDQIADQLEAAGHDRKGAELYGGLFKSMQSRLGPEATQEFFDKLGLKVNGPETAQAPVDGEQALNQKKVALPEGDSPAHKILAEVDSPKKAEALTGEKRQQYLNALDEVFGDREKRAKDAGFGDNLYHGTGSSKIVKFNETDRGIFASPDPYFANNFNDEALGEPNENFKGTTYPVRSRAENIFDYENAGHNEKLLKQLGEEVGRKKAAELMAKMKDNPTDNWEVLEEPSVINAIKDAGFDGYHISEFAEKNTATFDANKIRSTNAAFDPRFADSERILAQEGDGVNRGQIRIGEHSINIDLLKDANRSTFLHETGHFFLETLKTLSAHESAPDQLKEDFASVQKWLDHQGGDFTVEQHEKFAEGFERYLMEGKAPSEGLRKAFAAFRVWLTNIYKSIRNMRIDLNPEVRGVLDRMVATDDEINQAEQRQNRKPLFDETMHGLKVDKLEKYLDARQSARLEADDQLRAEVMEDVRRSETAAYEKQRAEVRGEVEKDAQNQRVFKAQSLLQRDQLPDGSPRPEGVPKLKISREDLRQRFGQEAVDEMPRMTTRDDHGMDVDMVADLLGYKSADVMVSELRKALPMKEFIERQTEAIMKDKNPSITQAELVESGMKYIHSEKQARVLEMEMEMLRDMHPGTAKGIIRDIVRRPPTVKEVRQLAENTIGGQVVRDLTPGQYQAAERRHAREKGERLAANDIDGAFDSVRMELLNHELYRAAVNAREDVNNSVRKFKKISVSDERLSKTRDVNLAQTAQAVLAAFGIGEEGIAPAEILDKLKRYDPEGYASAHVLVEMATAAGSGNYKEISYDRFQDMRDAVNGIWDLSRSQKQLEVEGRKVEKADVLAEMQSRIAEFGPSDRRPGYTEAITTADKTKAFLLSAKSSLRRAEAWVTAMDGGDKGIFRTHIWEPISNGTTKYRLAKEDALKYYRTNVVEPAKDVFDSTKKIYSPELGRTFVKNEIVGAMMHMGNESNLSKLLRGYGWGDVDGTGKLDTSRWDSFMKRMIKEGTVTKADFDYVQGVWDMYERIKPDSQKAHKAMYGYYFDEVTANPFTIHFDAGLGSIAGKPETYRGGYAPAIADPFMVEDQAVRGEKFELEQNGNSFMFPTTGRGFTKSRIESYAAPLSLDLRLIPMQLDKVLRFSHIEPAVRDVGKLIMDRDFKAQMNTIDQTAISDLLNPWLQRAASQSVSSPSGTGRAWKGLDYGMRRLRGNTGFNAMAGNVVNTFHQFTGLSVVTAKVDTKYVRSAMWQYVQSPKQTAEAVFEKSEFMRSKMNDVNAVHKEIEDVMLHPNKFEKVSDFIKSNGYILQHMAQHSVETVAWSAAYNKGLETGYSDHEAIKYADSIVRQTQHSSAPEDVSRFGTGSPFMRLFTQYFDYQNMKSNLLQTEAGNNYRELGLKKSMAKNVALYQSIVAIPAIMATAVMKGFAGDFFKDGDDNTMESNFLSIFFGGQFRELSSFIPIAGPLANTMISRFGSDQRYDDRMGLSSPAIDNAMKAVTLPNEIYHAIHEQGPKGPVIRDAMSLIGMMTGLPFQAAARPISYATDVAEGRITPANGLDYARGLITGTGPRH